MLFGRVLARGQHSLRLPLAIVVAAVSIMHITRSADAADRPAAPADGLVAYWPLANDAQDHSGRGRHGVSHGVRFQGAGEFNGNDNYVEIAPDPAFDFGAGDFSLTAEVWTAQAVSDVPGDVLSKFAGRSRAGFNLCLKSTAGGYNSHGDDKHVYFGIDQGRLGEWRDCGRPSPTSNYISNSLTVFDGNLYAGNLDAATESEWAHVYRYAGDQKWEDCGRLGSLRTRGAGPMVVHGGSLHVANWSYDWTRVAKDQLDNCHVYRYQGGQNWLDCGQPGNNRRLFSMASFQGGLFVVGEDNTCYQHDGQTSWKPVGQFPHYGHPMGIHNGKLYVGVLNPAGVFAYDGTTWKPLGNPLGDEKLCNQIHAIEVYQGRLYVTTWPFGNVAMYDDAAEKWIDCGRLGDSTEHNALVVYNGKLYAGTIPRGEVFRYEGEQEWTSLRRFFDPPGWEPIPVGRKATPGVNYGNGSKDWTRVTSLTVAQGRLFASIGSCTGSLEDAPADVRGKVFSIEAGRCASYDRDLGAGWKQLTAVRRGNKLHLYVDGQHVAESAEFNPQEYNITNAEPLYIGRGEVDFFSGKIREVRAYNRALNDREIAAMHGHAAR